MVCYIQHRIELNVHCQMDLLISVRKQPPRQQRMISTMFSMGSNTRPRNGKKTLFKYQNVKDFQKLKLNISIPQTEFNKKIK